MDNCTNFEYLKRGTGILTREKRDKNRKTAQRIFDTFLRGSYK